MRTLVYVALAFSLAITASVTLLSYALFPWLALGFAVVTLLGCILFRKSFWIRVPLVTLGLALGFLWMFLYPSLTYSHGATLVSDHPQSFTATLIDTPYEGDYWVALTVLLQHDDGNLKATLWLSSLPDTPLSIGDTLTGEATWDFSDPFMAETLTYSMTNNGIFLNGSVEGDLAVSTPDTPPYFVWASLLSQAVGEKLLSLFPEETRGLAIALLTGNTDAMDEQLYSNFQRAGVAHVVAVSGMHISFLAGMVAVFLRNRSSKISVLITILLFFSFAAVAGNTPSVLRAVFLQCFLIIAPLFQRERDEATSFAAALMILLLINPFSISGVSLQLSFGAILGIHLISDPLLQRWSDPLPQHPTSWYEKLRSHILRTVYTALSTTLGALLFTIPVMAFHFQSVSLISPLSNLLILWAISDAFLGCMLIAVTSFFLPFVSTVLVWVVSFLLQYVTVVVSTLATFPFAAIGTEYVYIQGWMVLIYGFIVVHGIQKARGRTTTPLLVYISVGSLLLAIALTVAQGFGGQLKVTVLDVGQGQSILFTSGTATALVDCGGDDGLEAGTMASDAIYALGSDHLDILILTHCHTDHAGGVATLLQQLSVGTLILPDTTTTLDLECEIVALAEAQGTQVLYLSTTATIEVGDATFTIYPPVSQADANEEGLFILCSCQEFDMLITGDANSDTELLFLDTYQLPDLEVLMVGHHGSSSSTSEQLIAQTTPEYAFISVGENYYGHPSQLVTNRLEDIQCEVYRTDLMGTITLTLN